MEKISLLIISLMILAGCQNNGELKKIKVAEQELKVTIADDSAKMAKGLGGREFLADDEGMLFVYPDYRRPGFWMKDMKFSIDIIWLKDKIITDITENVPVATTTPLKHYWPKEPVNQVLEVNAGFVSQKDIKIGDRIEFQK